MANADVNIIHFTAYGNSTDSNHFANMQLVAGKCSDPVNTKCGFTTLSCTNGTNVTITGFNGGGSGASATVPCAPANHIADGAALTFTAVGSGYTSDPTSASMCSGTGVSCTGSANVPTSARGSFVDIAGYSTLAATTSDYWIFAEMGNAGHPGSPEGSHYASVMWADYMNGNTVTLQAYDDGTALEPNAQFVGTTNAKVNGVTCGLRNNSNYPCMIDPSIFSGNNTYEDLMNRTQYDQKLMASTIGGTSYSALGLNPQYPVGTLNMDSKGTVAFVGDGSTAYLTSGATGTISIDQTSAGSHDGTLLVGNVGTLATPINILFSSGVTHNSGTTFAFLPLSAAPGDSIFCRDCTVAVPASCSTAMTSSCYCAGGGFGMWARFESYAGGAAHWYCQ